MSFCCKCGTKLSKNANYCPKCGMPIGYERAKVDTTFLEGKNQFIITSKLKDLKDTGSIMNREGKILAYFEHKHTWKPPKLKPAFGKPEAKTSDIRLISSGGGLLGEIHEFPPPRVWMWDQRPIRKWEIHNAKPGLEGFVREKHTALSSDWVLENLTGEVIAKINGNIKRTDYEILSNRNQIVACCYRSEKLDKNSYYLDLQPSEIDTFLVLGYVLVLHHAKSYPHFVRRGYVSSS